MPESNLGSDQALAEVIAAGPRARFVPSWDTLLRIRHLGVDSASKWALFLVPAIATAIAFSRAHGVNISLPVSLLTAYSSAFAFFVGSTLVDLFCPPIVKEHRDAKAWRVQQKKEREQLEDEFREEEARLNGASDELAAAFKLENSQKERRDVQAVLRDMTITLTAKHLEQFEREKWATATEEFFALRIAVTAFFSIAALVGLWVAMIDAPYKVFKLLL
jgi:hypothetical protein